MHISNALFSEETQKYPSMFNAWRKDFVHPCFRVLMFDIFFYIRNVVECTELTDDHTAFFRYLPVFMNKIHNDIFFKF